MSKNKAPSAGNTPDPDDDEGGYDFYADAVAGLGISVSQLSRLLVNYDFPGEDRAEVIAVMKALVHLVGTLTKKVSNDSDLISDDADVSTARNRNH